MASSYPPVKNSELIFYIGLKSQANPLVFQANPTLAAGDVKVAVDDGAPANLGTLPVVDADFTKRVKVTLSASEMNGDKITVIFSDAAGSEWCDLMLEIHTAAQLLDTMDTNIDAILSDTGTDGVVVAAGSKSGYNLVADQSGVTVGTVNALGTQAKADVNAEVDSALNTAIPVSPVADSVNERVKAIDDKLPTNYIMGSSVVTAKDDEIDAIKAKTDYLPAAPAATGDIPSAATIADAVWDEASVGHTDAGKAGAQMWTDIDAIAIDVAGLDGVAMRGTDNAALASVCTETRLAELDAANLITDVANVKTDTAAILADTGTDGVVVAAASKTGYALSTAGVDAILDDTPSAELASIPTTTSSLRLMIQFIFSYFRNKRTITSTTETLYKEDASTLLGTATVSDDGTTKTKGEIG